MATFNKFYSFVEDEAEGVHDLGSDQLMVALTNAANAPTASNTILANITQISYTNLSSRALTTTSSAQTTGTYKLVLENLELEASGAVPAFRYIVVYNDTATNKPLIGWVDYGSEVTLQDTDTFLIKFDQVNGAINKQ